MYKLEKVQWHPVRNGTGGLWYREVLIAGMAGVLQGHRVWPQPHWCRLMVLCKHLHTGCQDLSQRLIETFHWNPCEVTTATPQATSCILLHTADTNCVCPYSRDHTHKWGAGPVSWNTMQCYQTGGITACIDWWMGRMKTTDSVDTYH